MVSRVSREYYRQLHKGQAFGAAGFSLDDLRTCMATRRVSTDSDARCCRTFQSHEPLLPEGREAIEHIAGFMRSCLGHG